MKEKVNFLNPDEIKALTSQYEVLTFGHDFDLVYENQIPVTGIALIEGKIEFIKRSKPFFQIAESCILGIQDLMNGTPIKHGCRIKGNSKIVLIGKSEILDILKNQKSKLFNLVKDSKIEG